MADNLLSLAQQLHSEHSIQLSDLFPESFMKKHTDFNSIEVMLISSGFGIASQQDYEKIPPEKWDKLVKEHTKFASWKEMQAIAYQEWLDRSLNS